MLSEKYTVKKGNYYTQINKMKPQINEGDTCRYGITPSLCNKCHAVV